MEYHNDRFIDASQLIFEDNTLVAVFPANSSDGQLYSHQGLSYGGLIIQSTLKLSVYLAIFKALLAHLHSEQVKCLHIKELPSFYCTLPSEELAYCQFIVKAETTRIDITGTVDYRRRIPFSRNRNRGVERAQKKALQLKEEAFFEDFWNEILIPNRQEKHNVSPTHSLTEIKLLHQRFPEKIRQFNIYYKESIVAGATVFETETTAHVQYAAANNQRQELGALDFLFEKLINKVFMHKAYFDFGISNENQGRNLNEGLGYWKESFGARSFVHRFYKIKTENHTYLENVLL